MKLQGVCAIYSDGSRETYRGYVDEDTFKVRVTRPGRIVRFEFDEVESGFLVARNLVVAVDEDFPKAQDAHLRRIRVTLHPMD